jgi:hypothetical protein
MKHYKHDIALNGRPYVEFVDVKCPSCKGKAVATSNALSCTQCNLLINEKWYGPISGIAACNCLKCGRSLHRRFSYVKNQLSYRFRCAVCSTVNNTVISWYKRRIDGKDPYFGLDYFLSVEFKGNQFWIHNRGHLEDLRVYIASHRVAGLSRTMIRSLPGCVKESSNKSALLELIDSISD